MRRFIVVCMYVWVSESIHACMYAYERQIE